MTDKKIDQLLTGNYDGIEEYDNDLPKWWIYLFYLTIAFAPIYVIYVHFLGTPSDQERVAVELQALKDRQANYAKQTAPKEKSAVELIKLSTDQSHIAKGQLIFTQKCLACHGAKGEGVVGPNLTDEYWIHGGKIEKIHHTIEVGVPEKGMLAWKTLMSQDEIDDVTAFIWSIRNTNVPGKAPQGDKE